MSKEEIISFLIRAKKATYAGKGAETTPTRPKSHDLTYSEGECMYYDTYLGGANFAGEEALWLGKNPYWSMNYAGRVVGENFSGDFLKEALSNVPAEMPYRGPKEYSSGDYAYECRVSGEFEWFCGSETISFRGQVIYECNFHGGIVK